MIYSFLNESFTIGYLTDKMLELGWVIKCFSKPADGDQCLAKYLLKPEVLVTDVADVHLFGWRPEYKEAHQLERDVVKATPMNLTYLRCYGIYLAFTFISAEPHAEVLDGNLAQAYGRVYMQAWHKAKWCYSVANLGNSYHHEWGRRFVECLAQVIEGWGYGLIERGSGQFTIRDEQGSRTYHAFDVEGKRGDVALEPETDDSTDYISEVRTLYAQSIEPSAGQPIGCAKQEIETFERRIGFRLPLAYKQYLMWMGKKSKGPWWERKATELNRISANTFGFCLWDSYFNMKMDGDYELPESYLVFLRDGESGDAGWFHLPKENENPPIYYYGEYLGRRRIQKFESFADFVLSCLDKDAKWLERHRQRQS